MSIKSRKSSLLNPHRRRRQSKRAFSADHYRNLRQTLEKIRRIKKNHSTSMSNNVNDISERWVSYYKNVEEDGPNQHIKDVTFDDVVLFRKRNLDNHLSRKRSSICQKFKHWCQLYWKYAEKEFDPFARQDINDVHSV